jgi:excisionase family DNA binding protein
MTFKLDTRTAGSSVQVYIYVDDTVKREQSRLILTTVCNSFWEIDDEIYKLIGELERLRKRAKAAFDKPPQSQLQTDTLKPHTLLNAADIAARLNISRSHAYKLLKRREIPTVRLGRAIRVRPEDLDAFIRENIGK